MQRLFLAVPLTDEAREEIATSLPADLPGRVVPAANWHLTLRFLGDTPADARDRLVQEIGRTRLGEAFAIRFGRLGAFPNPGRARVLWIRVDKGAAELAALAATAEAAVRRAGFPREDKPFRAHLTLSRLRPSQSVVPLVEGSRPAEVTMPVEEVVLYRSHLGGGPVRYEAVARFPLS